jgi:hypothetical protein
MELNEMPRKRRVMDKSNRDARQAIADIVAKFGNWRQDLATLAARVERQHIEDERSEILTRCSAIEQDVQGARMDIIVSLADAPRRVAGHGRVVDVERALDNIERALSAIRSQLSRTDHTSSATSMVSGSSTVRNRRNTSHSRCDTRSKALRRPRLTVHSRWIAALTRRSQPNACCSRWLAASSSWLCRRISPTLEGVMVAIE